MTALPIVLAPATPSELLSDVLARCRHPTTLLVGYPKKDFFRALSQDVWQQIHKPPPTEAPDNDGDPTSPTPHPLLKATLMQVAVSRHIRIAFIPSVTHLRAYLSVFSPADSKISAPPISTAAVHPPLLLVYGFLELHRDASEWSAQGIGNSLATLIDGATRAGFRAAVVEPKGEGIHENLGRLLAEELPLLNGTPLRDDGTWAGRTVPVRRVFARWFEFEPHEEGEDRQS